MDFVILDIKKDEKRPFILGTPFLITAKAVIKFIKGTITLNRKTLLSYDYFLACVLFIELIIVTIKPVPVSQAENPPFIIKTSSPQHKPELRPTKDFKAKYNKVKAKLTLLSLSASASKASMVKNKGLIVEAYEWDEEEVSSDDNEMVEVKVFMTLAEDKDVVSKEGARNGE
nr:hypothetical protein [Tanacetum cinerariifolium]